MNNELLDSQVASIENILIKQYKSISKNIIAEANKMYLDILESGREMTYSEMMRYDRYFKLLASIQKELNKLGQTQITVINQGMIDLYNKVGEQISGNENFALVNRFYAEEAVKRVWCEDGLTLSDRVWKNMTTLRMTLEEGLANCVIAGKSHKYLEKELQHRFHVSQSAASRLARTELNYIQNQGAMRGYLDAGYTHYKFITAIDGRQCDECGKLNGKIFAFDEAEVGVNLPPIHSNCRSNIIGVKI